MPIFDAGGFSLFYNDEGQGEPMILLHGFPLSSEMWQPQRAALRNVDFAERAPHHYGQPFGLQHHVEFSSFCTF